MPDVPPKNKPPKDKATGAAFKKWMLNNNKNVETVAHEGSFSTSFLQQLSSGQYTEKGLAKVERYIGEKIRVKDPNDKKASDELGGYLLDDKRGFIGKYLLARFSEEDSSMIETYEIDIDWDKERPGLAATAEIGGVQHISYVSIPQYSSHIFIASSPGGWARLAILSIPNQDGAIYGVLLSMGLINGGICTPMLTPVFMKKIVSKSELHSHKVSKGSVAHNILQNELNKVSEKGYILSRISVKK
jgi:hypothetical protein